MKYLKILPVFLLLAFGTIVSCEEEEIEQTDNLDEIGILGKWSLQSLTINGITDLTIRYDTLLLSTGVHTDDLKGSFESAGPAYETTGLFELDKSNNTIFFDYNNTEKVYEFHISGNSMTFTYFEDSHEFLENWRKI